LAHTPGCTNKKKHGASLGEVVSCEAESVKNFPHISQHSSRARWINTVARSRPLERVKGRARVS
jgi:hypothetical protein